MTSSFSRIRTAVEAMICGLRTVLGTAVTFRLTARADYGRALLDAVAVEFFEVGVSSGRLGLWTGATTLERSNRLASLGLLGFLRPRQFSLDASELARHFL